MDLREYYYLATRPDYFPRSTLQSIRAVLAESSSLAVRLIDNVLINGHIEPPEEYGFHGCYNIILSSDEKHFVFQELELAVEKLTKQDNLTSEQLHSLSQFQNHWERLLSEEPESYDDYKARQSYFDLRNISLEQFQEFIFNHPASNIISEDDVWYLDFNIWIDYDELYVKDLLIKLFTHSHKLIEQYSLEQLDQGMWAIMGPNLNPSAYNLIWGFDCTLRLKDKIELIESMYFLFEKLFSQSALDTSCNMWWDSFAYNYCVDGLTDTKNTISDKVIQDAMFKTLSKILSLESKDCQLAALHGLGHLRHPKTKKLINEYLNSNSSLNDEEIAYAKACILGDIM